MVKERVRRRRLTTFRTNLRQLPVPFNQEKITTIFFRQETLGQMWYVARVITGQRLSAPWYLARAGFPTFEPRVVLKDMSNREMFPGYLFVMMPDVGLAARVARTPGVMGLLPLGAEQPAAVPDGFIEELIDRGPLRQEAADVVIHRWTRGAAVEVVGGAWIGCAGDVIGYRGDRVEVMIQGLFRAGVKAFVPEGMLREGDQALRGGAQALRGGAQALREVGKIPRAHPRAHPALTPRSPRSPPRKSLG